MDLAVWIGIILCGFWILLRFIFWAIFRIILRYANQEYNISYSERDTNLLKLKKSHRRNIKFLDF